MGNISITSFENLEQSFLNSTKIESFQCIVLDLFESEEPNFFIFKVLLANEINEEFFLSKYLLINTIKMKRIDDEKYLSKNQENEIENIDIENYGINQIKNHIINFYIVIDKIEGLVKTFNKKYKLYFLILNFKIKEKNFLNIMPSIKRKYYFI